MDTREARRRGTTPRHPWERARLAHVRAVLRVHGVDVGAHIVDVGAGDAYVAAALSDEGHDVVAVDNAWSDGELAAVAAVGPQARRELSGVHDADVALLLDVLEHVDDDVALLNTSAATLRSGGLIVITVPAWPHLMSSHDDALGHRRRYTPRTLRRLMEQTPLTLVEWGGCFHSLTLVRAWQVLRQEGKRSRPPKMTPLVDDVAAFSAPAVAGDALTAILTAELAFSRALSRRGHHLPGLSLYAVARAP